MREFVYPARFTRERRDGGYRVSFRDMPEALTQGDSISQCIEEAAGALQAAIEGRMMDGMEIPSGSRPGRGERSIAVPVCTALKAALYLAMREQGMTRVGLAQRLHIDEKEARRMLDPHHATKADRLERALAALGRHAEVRVT